MASLYADIVTYLKTASGVTNLVGAGANARIYLDQAKQGEKLPYLVLVTFEGESHAGLSGQSGLENNAVEIMAYGKTVEQAYQLAQAVRFDSGGNAVLDGKDHFTLGSRYCNSCLSQGSALYGTDDPSPGQHTPRYWVSRVFVFNHQEALTG